MLFFTFTAFTNFASTIFHHFFTAPYFFYLRFYKWPVLSKWLFSFSHSFTAFSYFVVIFSLHSFTALKIPLPLIFTKFTDSTSIFSPHFHNVLQFCLNNFFPHFYSVFFFILLLLHNVHIALDKKKSLLGVILFISS